MKLKLGLVRFDRGGGWQFCLACRSAPGGEPVPGTMVYYALDERVCDSCVKRGAEHIRKALKERADKLQREADRFAAAAAEGLEIPAISIEERAKAELWGERHVEDYFGVCPACGAGSHYLNVGRDHWFYCDEHEVCWFVGSNLFDSWRREDEETWRRNEEKLRGFRVVYKNVEDDLDLIPTEAALRAAERRFDTVSPADFAVFPF